MRRAVIHLAVHHRHGVDADLGAGRIELEPDIPGLALDQRRDEASGTRYRVSLMPVDIRRRIGSGCRAEVAGTGRACETTGLRKPVGMTRIESRTTGAPDPPSP